MKNFLLAGAALTSLALIPTPGLAGVEVGDKAPPLSAKAIEGPLKSLDGIKGKVVLYKFFAFW